MPKSLIAWRFVRRSNWRFAWLGHFDGPVGHFWSLAVEEQVYLLWPVIVLWLPRRWLLPTAWGAVALAVAGRFALARMGCNSLSASMTTPTCLDALGIGAVLAITGRAPRGRVAVAGLALIVAATILHDAGRAMPLWLATGKLGWSLLSWWLLGRAADGFGGAFGWLLESRPLRQVGKISYGIYVIHGLLPAISEWSRYRFGTSLGMPQEEGFARLLYVLIVSSLLASLSWRYLEGPLNDLKRFFPYVTRPRRGPAEWSDTPPDIDFDGEDSSGATSQETTRDEGMGLGWILSAR